jgi:hypothetical protein
MTYPVGHVLDAAHTAALEARVADPQLAGAHLCVDLGEVEQVTDDGVAALARCREVAARAGVHLSYRAATRAGRLALLATWSRNR